MHFDATADVTITGGSGDDTIDMGGDFDDDDTLDGGDGEDTLEISQTGGLGEFNATNFEAVQVNTNIGADRTIDMDGVEGLTTISVEGTNNANDGSHTHELRDIATTATTINFTGDGTDDVQEFDGVNVDYDSTSAVDSVTVNIGNDGTEAQDVVVHDLQLSNVTNISIVATDIGTDTNEELTVESALVASDAESLSVESNSDVDMNGVTGSTDLSDISVDGSGGVNFGTVSAFADGLTVTLGDGDDEITLSNASTNGSSIETGAGDDIIGVGNDNDHEIALGDGANTVNLLGGAQDDGAALISNFDAGTGGDVLGFDASEVGGGVASALTNSVVNVAGAASNSIIVDDANTGYANFTAAEADVEAQNAATEDYILGFFNTSSNQIEFYADADSSAAGNGVLLATFDDVNSSGDADPVLQGLATQNFDVF